MLASLNHPGIAAIYGIEEDEGTHALVLELVEGPTLADRISKGPSINALAASSAAAKRLRLQCPPKNFSCGHPRTSGQS